MNLLPVREEITERISTYIPRMEQGFLDRKDPEIMVLGKSSHEGCKPNFERIGGCWWYQASSDYRGYFDRGK